MLIHAEMLGHPYPVDVDQRPTRIEIVVPDELRNGDYADIVSVWHNPYGFTLDFGVLGQPALLSETGPDGEEAVIQANVVARLKVPATVIFQIARAIADNVSKFEAQFGEITPRPPDGSAIVDALERQEQDPGGETDEDGDDSVSDGD